MPNTDGITVLYRIFSCDLLCLFMCSADTAFYLVKDKNEI